MSWRSEIENVPGFVPSLEIKLSTGSRRARPYLERRRVIPEIEQELAVYQPDYFQKTDLRSDRPVSLDHGDGVEWMDVGGEDVRAEPRQVRRVVDTGVTREPAGLQRDHQFEVAPLFEPSLDQDGVTPE